MMRNQATNPNPTIGDMNELRENDMLENKTTITVGAVSAAIAGLAFIASLLLTPSAALADNECDPIGTDPSANGATADSYDCDQSSYGDGVTYTADGDLTVEFTLGTVTEVESGGIDLTATGGDSIFFNSAGTSTEIESRAVTGPLLDVLTATGDIDIDTEEMDADAQTPNDVTHAIRARSTSGNISITATGPVDAESGNNPGDSIGIEAATGGAGSLTIELSSSVRGRMIGIDATGGTGLLTIQGGSVAAPGAFGFGSSTGLLVNAGGDVLIDGTAANADIGMDITAAGDITINNTGTTRGDNSLGGFAIRASGNSLVLNNDGSIGSGLGFGGAMNLSLTDGYIFNNNGLWGLRTASEASGNVSNLARVSTLGAGTLNNAGLIRFGLNKEVVLAQGTTFNGLSGSMMDMPVRAADMTPAGQTGCTPDTVTVAGCLNLSGGATTGETSILITTPTPSVETDRGLTAAASPGILLVDVSGGTSASGHFVLDPDSEDYQATSLYGPVLTTSEPAPLVYALLYNPDTQQHILSTVPTAEGIEYGSYIGEAMSIWHTTADTVVGRQADLRERGGRGGWARLVSESSERDTALSVTTQGNTFVFDMDYERDTDALIFGFDAMYGDNYVIGLHGGLIESETDYDRTGNDSETEGAMAGVYGGWWQDNGISVDAALNVNFLTLDHYNSYEVSHTDIRTMGLRAEAAWKYAVSESFYVQPLATVAYVIGRLETTELRLNDVSYEDEESQRAALGLRLGGDMDLSIERFTRLEYWLTAKAWEEFAEDGSANYLTPGDPVSVAEDISESFEEVGLGASLSNAEGNVSVFLSGNLQSGDQTDSTNVTLGARLRW